MNLGQLSINRPILAMVLSIVLLIVGAIAYTHAAGGGISASSAADRGGHYAISWGFRPDRFRHRRRADRAADQRRRGHALPLQPGDIGRQLTITVTFKLGTDLDKAQVLVQNRVAIAQPAIAARGSA